MGWGTNFPKGRRPVAYRVFTVKHVCAGSLLGLFLCEVCMYHQNKTAAFCTLGGLKWRCLQDDYSAIWSFLDDQILLTYTYPSFVCAVTHDNVCKKLGLLHFFSSDCVYRNKVLPITTSRSGPSHFLWNFVGKHYFRSISVLQMCFHSELHSYLCRCDI